VVRRIVWAMMCWAMALPAGLLDPRPGITIRIVNFAGVPNATLQRAEREASHILGKAGVAAVWLDCDAALTRDVCRSRPGPSELWLHLLKQRPRGLVADAAGFARVPPPQEGDGNYAAISCPVVMKAAKDLEAGVPVLLGITMAHEIGHLLLGPKAHSPGGIMRPRFGRGDVLLANWGELLFTPEQAARIRVALAARR